MLLCPKCDEPYMHQERVVQYVRKREDGPNTALWFAPDGTPRTRTFSPQSTMNPSSRRHAVTIDFYCEYCDTNERGEVVTFSQLTISQHKGVTYLNWREVDAL